MTGPCLPIRTQSRFDDRHGGSLSLLTAPAALESAALESAALESAALESAAEEHAPRQMVLIVLPPGPEYARCYRLLRELAVALAASGVPVLRLELTGTGNSPATTLPSELAVWHLDIIAAATQLKARWPNAALVGLGVRYGARLMLDALGPARAHSGAFEGTVDGWVFWSPLLHGAEWLAHLHSVDARMQEADLTLDACDMAGLAWPAPLVEELRAQNHAPDVRALPASSVCLIDADSGIELLSHLNQIHTDISSTDWQSAGLPMLVSAEVSAGLLEALQEVVHSVATAAPGRGSPPGKAAPASGVVSAAPAGVSCDEPFCLGSGQVLPAPAVPASQQLDRGLFGVYRPGSAPCPVVVMLNSGLLGCSGPYGLYASLAEHLTRLGVASVRFDFSGKGESPRKPLAGVQAILDDYAQVNDFLRSRGHTQTILLGICSGADDALELAQLTDNVAGLVLLDGYAPKTAGFVRHYYQERLMSPARIKSWLLRKAGSLFKTSSTGAADHPGQTAQLLADGVLELRRWATPAEMRARYLKVLENQCATLALFTGALRDDYYNHANQLGRALGQPEGLTERYLPHMNHLYPSSSQRAELFGLVTNWLTGAFGDAIATRGNRE